MAHRAALAVAVAATLQAHLARARTARAAAERHRSLERDLHDGAQQRLVALALELKRAQHRLTGGELPEIEPLIASSVEQLHLAVHELRDLVRGCPPADIGRGLGEAVGLLAERMPLPVLVGSLPEGLPRRLERAAYFVACEALVNVVKHAQATSATVSARRTHDTLVIEVTDDGVGGARPDGGTGLYGLAERVSALGGRVVVESPVGGGTRVTGEIPCAS